MSSEIHPTLRLKPKNVKNTVVNVDFWVEILRGIILVQRATVLINMSRSRHVNLGLAAWITNTSRHSSDITSYDITVYTCIELSASTTSVSWPERPVWQQQSEQAQVLNYRSPKREPERRSGAFRLHWRSGYIYDQHIEWEINIPASIELGFAIYASHRIVHYFF